MHVKQLGGASAHGGEQRTRPLLPLMLPDSALWREPCREPPRPPTTPDSLLSRPPAPFPSPSSLHMSVRQRAQWRIGESLRCWVCVMQEHSLRPMNKTQHAGLLQCCTARARRTRVLETPAAGGLDTAQGQHATQNIAPQDTRPQPSKS